MDVRSLSSEELSHLLGETGRRWAQAEKDWFWAQEYKKILQAELTLNYEKTEGVTKAQAMARVDPKFRDWIEQMKSVLEERNVARVEYDEIQTEIKRRLNLSFVRNREYQSGHLVT